MANRNYHHFFIFTTQIFLVLFCILSSLFVFHELSRHIFGQTTLFVDKTVLEIVSNTRSPRLTALMLASTHLADIYILVSLAFLAFFYLYPNRKKDAIVFIFILISGAALNLVLKNTFDRPRPNINPISQLDSYSFPSGHAMNGFLLYTSLSYFIARKIKNRAKALFLMSACASIILIVGLSRIYLGVHYPTDVIAGYMAGLFWFAGVILFQKAISSLLTGH